MQLPLLHDVDQVWDRPRIVRRCTGALLRTATQLWLVKSNSCVLDDSLSSPILSAVVGRAGKANTKYNGARLAKAVNRTPNKPLKERCTICAHSRDAPAATRCGASGDSKRQDHARRGRCARQEVRWRVPMQEWRQCGPRAVCVYNEQHTTCKVS